MERLYRRRGDKKASAQRKQIKTKATGLQELGNTVLVISRSRAGTLSAFLNNNEVHQAILEVAEDAILFEQLWEQISQLLERAALRLSQGQLPHTGKSAFNKLDVGSLITTGSLSSSSCAWTLCRSSQQLAAAAVCLQCSLPAYGDRAST